MDPYSFAAVLVVCVAIVAIVIVAIAYRPDVAKDTLDLLRRLIELLREALSIRRLF
jgi:hypothetical protein